MTHQPDEARIKRLLADLRSWGWSFRRDAALEIARRGLKDARLMAALTALAATDGSAEVKKAARVALGTEAPEEPLTPMPSVAELDGPMTRNEKLRDFLIGLVGWYVVNGAIWLMLFRGRPIVAEYSGWAATIYALFITAGNLIAVLIIFARRRGWMALGILATYPFNLLLAMIFGLGFLVKETLASIPFNFLMPTLYGLGVNATFWIPFFIR
jgi:hypothetical protein